MIRHAVARGLEGDAVLVTMRRGERGPWTVVVDRPGPDRPALGPPPGYLALVGIASCTIVTVAGVASRGESALQGMQVRFDVSDGADGSPSIAQRTTLETTPTERDRIRLTRAVEHCPVGKDFTKRGVEIDDVIEVSDGVAAPVADLAAPAPPAADAPAPPAFVPGRVVADYLVESAEWGDVDGRPVLDQEGEVRIHVETADGEATARHWGFLGGHTSAGWAPRPSAYAIAALASSTLLTLRDHAERLGLDRGSLEVEVAVVSDRPTGGKEASQEAAASGRSDRVRWRRTVRARTAGGPAAAADDIRLVIDRDPIVGYLRRGDLLSADTVEIVPARHPVPA